MIDPQRQRIQEDLRGLVRGDVLCDDLTLQLYATDASIFQIKPLGMVRPRTTEDVAAILKYATEQKIPIHARGAGTGLAGESLGAGLIVDFSRYMRRVLETGPDWVRIQPGVVHAKLNEHLRKFNRVFGPDPAMSQVTTMGSVVAIDASGSHWLQYGSARNHIRSMEVVLADGTILQITRDKIVPQSSLLDAPATPNAAAQTKHQEIVERLSEILSREKETIENSRPRALLNRAGYQLHSLGDSQHLDLTKLICGSEGTLALITELVVDTQPLPKYKVAALLFFASLEHAVQAVPDLLATGPGALDMLDRRHLSLAREADPQFNSIIPQETEGLLLIEFAGDHLQTLQEQLQKATDLIWKQKRLAFDVRIAADHDELRLIWRLPRRVTPTLQKIGGAARPVPFVEDVAVPLDELANFLVSMQNSLKRHQVIASLYGHVGHGQLHIRPFIDMNNAAEVAKLHDLANDLYTETLAVGGTICGEHGAGLSRSPYLRNQFGPLYQVFKEVKQIFDPLNILNPGKIFFEAQDEPLDNLRSGWQKKKQDDRALVESFISEKASEIVGAPPADAANSDLPVLTNLHLNWSAAELLQETKSCNGCGACRTQLFDQRMCPIFRVTPGEEASPRAKANLMRGIMTGDLDPDLLQRNELKQIADLCVNCHQCRMECPVNVDIPKLMIEAKAAHVATNGFSTKEWFFANVDKIARWGSPFATVANWIMSNRQMRWLLERMTGLAHNRKLPRLSQQTFYRWAARRKLTRSSRRNDRKVLYFADTYVNYFDAQLGKAFVHTYEHNGVSVFVPPEALHAGMPQVTMGAVEAVRDQAAKTVAFLADHVRQGYSIVATEPSTVMCLTQHYPTIFGDDDAKLVSTNTFEACDYLWRLHQQGSLQLDLKPIHATVGYHLPCHSRALHDGAPAENLMRLITGLQVQRIDKGCSGMAGTYGLHKDNFRTSLRAGWELISAMRESAIQVGATECSACKMQMEQGVNKATIHPLKWLALSYGLMPELEEMWQQRVSERVVS